MNKFEVDDKPTESRREIPGIDLWYPRLDGNAKALEIGLLDVRAADSLQVSYDFDRDGWSIKQASRFMWHSDDHECDSDWQEVAFVPAWGREESEAEAHQRIATFECVKP